MRFPSAEIIILTFFFLTGCMENPVKSTGKPLNTVSLNNLTDDEIAFLTVQSKNGLSSAAFRLYRYYNFTENDVVSSRIFLRRAAELGNATAQFNLATLLTEEVELRDLDQAEKWLVEAERKGCADDEDFPDLSANLRKRINELRNGSRQQGVNTPVGR